MLSKTLTQGARMHREKAVKVRFLDGKGIGRAMPSTHGSIIIVLVVAAFPTATTVRSFYGVTLPGKREQVENP